MPRVRLPTINDPPEGRTVLNAATPEPDAHPYFSSRGDLDLACGRCDRVLAENVLGLTPSIAWGYAALALAGVTAALALVALRVFIPRDVT